MTTRTVDLAALHRSAADGTLELQYQPEVDLATGAIVAMEGLLRWHTGDLGVLAPIDFLDLAERSGDIVPIGEWVLREGAAEAASWRTLPGPTRQLFINVSAAQLADEHFAQHVAAVVEEHGLPDGALGLDIAERTVLALGDDALPVLQELRACGVAIAVDDFTTWYGALGAIEALPVDGVKLGHRYVRGVGDSDHDPILETVVKEAHARGLYVVAEGVESWAESARLVELGCDRAHGWLFASPQRADKARWLLAQGTGWCGTRLTPDAHAAPFVPSPRASS